ncbi:MAG: CRTAC1 family protein [Phycisphaerales bacterium]
MDTQRLLSSTPMAALFGIVAGTVVSGAAAGDPLSFSDEALARGVNFTMGFNYAQYGSGSVLADLDGDGDLDIFIAGGSSGSIAVYENDGTGNFTNRTAGSGLSAMNIASGTAGADYDNDGDIDIYISGWNTPSRLYRNNGDFTFTDVAAIAGVNVSCPSMGASWGDVDGDGLLDLYASVRTLTNGDLTRNFMYMNNGDGTFTDQAGPMGIDAGNDPTLLSAFFDYDGDGDIDLYLGTDKGSGGPTGVLFNKLYRNDGGGNFTDVTFDANAQAYVDCMGIAVGDLDFDGYFDLYVTNTQQGNKLLMHDGVSAYVDETAAAGVGSYYVGWGTVFADFDNDTQLDTYVCNMQGPNRLYRGSQTWPLIDEGPSAGVDEANDVFCVSVGDIDGDNDLDMLVGNTNGRVRLYINNSPGAATNNWVRFNVVGHDANRFAIGAGVRISADGKNQMREVRSGVNYKTHDEYTLHFGLADAAVVDDILITFNNNAQTRTLTGAPVNQTWTLYPQSRLGDSNGNGRIEYAETREALDRFTPPGGTISPGEEIYDMNGDFVIDMTDIRIMGEHIVRPPKGNRVNAGQVGL